MSDTIWLRGCKLWYFQGRGINVFTDTFCSLPWILGETGYESILEPALTSVREEWG